MSENMQQFRLPDLLAEWPYPRNLNPHYLDVKAASGAWLESFNAFDAKAQKAFNKGDFNLLAALAYPFADKEQLRVFCDLMNMFFLFDEYTDVENDLGARELGDIVLDAFRNPEKARPPRESIVGEIVRQFWQLAIRTVNESSQRRFIDAFDHYISSVVQQADDRTHHRTRGIDSYLSVRRETIGVKPSLVMLQLDIDLPDEVVGHADIKSLEICAIDMILLSNDIYSYNVEQARGDDTHNMVTIVMHELNTDLPGAIDWIASYHKEIEAVFQATKAGIPAWGDAIDAQVAKYIYGLGNWVRANDTWSFESQRYFGKKGRQVQELRMVELLPAVH